MRLVLFALPADARKADRIANMEGDDGLNNGVAIQMRFLPIGNTQRQRLSEGTKMEIMGCFGLFEEIESVVVLMHAGPGALSTQGARGAGGILDRGLWDLRDLIGLLRRWRPTHLFFLCCRYAANPTREIAHVRVMDSAGYILARVQGLKHVLADRLAVMTITGMPLLRYDFYSRHAQ